jgi:hypothetical protein
MFNVISKIKNRIGTATKQPEPQEVKPEIVKVEPAQLEIAKVETTKKARKPRKEMSTQLQIILEVMEFVRRDGHGRVKAIQLVAEARGISRSTVGDKCGRLLGLTSDTFDKMLSSPDMQELRLLLIQRFPAKVDIINAAINELITPPKNEKANSVLEQSEEINT